MPIAYKMLMVYSIYIRRWAFENRSTKIVTSQSNQKHCICDVNMVPNVHRNRKAYLGRGEGGGGGGGTEVGGGGDYIYRYTVTIRMTPALRWAVMRGILMFH